jgi:Uri superfamily endonuclease
MLGAVIVPGQRTLECVLAKRLAETFGVPAARFGSSDCRCGSHLFVAERL